MHGVAEYDLDAYRAILVEEERRKSEALRLYEPNGFQKLFHESMAMERILMAGNQVGKAERNDQRVLTPDGWVAISDLQVGDRVIGGDGQPCTVLGVYPQGEKETYRLTFDDGASVICCEEHLWKCKLGKRERFGAGRHAENWSVRSLKEIREFGGDNPLPLKRMAIPVPRPVELRSWPVPIDPYMLGVLIGDGGLTNGVGFTSADGEIVSLVSAAAESVGCVVRKLNGKRFGYSVVSDGTRNAVLQSLKSLGLYGKRSHEKFVPRCYLWNSPDVRLAILQGLMDTDGSVSKKTHCHAGGAIEYCTTSRQLAEDVVYLVRSLGGKCKVRWRITSFTHDGVRKQGKPSARIRIRLPKLPLFRLTRKQMLAFDATSTCDHRVLYKIEPLGKAECTCIAVNSVDHTFVTEDFIVTHNSLAAFVELARAVTGQDPLNRYPQKDGVAMVVSYDEKSIGTNVYRYLFRPGQFKIIQDLVTKEWRTFRPWRPEDAARAREAKPAPPLIPKRMIKGKIAYRRKGTRIIAQFELVNGWIVLVFSSKADPAGGFQSDFALIDEDLDKSEWYDETLARLSIRSGRLVWGALPLAHNDAMTTALIRAEEQRGKPNPTIEVFKATVFDNPYLDAATRERNVAAWKAKGDDVYRKRALGHMILDSWLMYPMFDKRFHSVVKHQNEGPRLPVQQAVTDNRGMPPANWTRYMIVDPGFSVCAVGFFAVPPPAIGDHAVLYDLLYMRNCIPTTFGEAVEKKTRGFNWEEFIIDMHGAKLRGADEKNTLELYTEQLKLRGVQSNKSGFSFTPASDDTRARADQFREWLATRPDGTPKFMYVPQHCEDFEREIRNFKKQKDARTGHPSDDANRRQPCHAIETCEYAAGHGLPYVEPKKVVAKLTSDELVGAAESERAKWRRMMHHRPGQRNHVHIGPRGVPA
jgi:hypothetical protein